MGFDCINSLSLPFYLLCLFLLCLVYKLTDTEFPITKIGRELPAKNMRYKHIGYNVDVMRQSACLVVNPITVNNFAVLFNCLQVGRGSRLYDSPNIRLII